MPEPRPTGIRRGSLATRSARSIVTDPTLLRYALAHHPTCSPFTQDLVVARIGRRRVPLCAGCVVFWPVLLLVGPLLLYGALRTATPWWSLLAIGSALGSVQLLSYAGRARTRTVKLVVKTCLALGAGAVISALIVAPGPAYLRIGAGLALGAVTALVHTQRLKNLQRVCDACAWKRDWQYCPGFAPINDHIPGSTPSGWHGDPHILPAAWPWHASETQQSEGIPGGNQSDPK